MRKEYRLFFIDEFELTFPYCKMSFCSFTVASSWSPVVTDSLHCFKSYNGAEGEFIRIDSYSYTTDRQVDTVYLYYMRNAPSLQQLQLRLPPKKGKRLPKLYIRRVKLVGGRYEFRIQLDRLQPALLWCAKGDRKATEQRLIERYADNRVFFYTLK